MISWNINKKALSSALFAALTLFLPAVVSAQAAAEETTAEETTAEEPRSEFSITKKGGHLYSRWEFNGVETRVFLETAFPKIVFDRSFVEANNHRLGFDLRPAPENLAVAFWGYNRKHKVVYVINQTISVNGVDVDAEALVVDLAAIDKKERDVIFPIDLLPCGVEIDIKSGKMRLFPTGRYPWREGAEVYEMAADSSARKRQYYIESELVCRSKRHRASISGRFLLDIGSGNAFTFNKFNEAVPPFVKKAAKTQSRPVGVGANNLTNLTVVYPDSLFFDGIFMPETFVCAMDLFTDKRDRFTGIAGNGFFERFVAGFDFADRKLYLKPRE